MTDRSSGEEKRPMSTTPTNAAILDAIKSRWMGRGFQDGDTADVKWLIEELERAQQEGTYAEGYWAAWNRGAGHD